MTNPIQSSLLVSTSLQGWPTWCRGRLWVPFCICGYNKELAWPRLLYGLKPQLIHCTVKCLVFFLPIFCHKPTAYLPRKNLWLVNKHSTNLVHYNRIHEERQGYGCLSNNYLCNPQHSSMLENSICLFEIALIVHSH